MSVTFHGTRENNLVHSHMQARTVVP